MHVDTRILSTAKPVAFRKFSCTIKLLILQPKRMRTLPSIKGDGSTFHCVDRVLSQVFPNFEKVTRTRRCSSSLNVHNECWPNWKIGHATNLRTTNFTTAAADETAAAAVLVATLRYECERRMRRWPPRENFSCVETLHTLE